MLMSVTSYSSLACVTSFSDRFVASGLSATRHKAITTFSCSNSTTAETLIFPFLDTVVRTTFKQRSFNKRFPNVQNYPCACSATLISTSLQIQLVTHLKEFKDNTEKGNLEAVL